MPLHEQDANFNADGIEETDDIEISFEENDDSIMQQQKQQLQNRKKSGSFSWLSSWCIQSTAFFLDIPNKNLVDTSCRTTSDGKSRRENASIEVHSCWALMHEMSS